VNTVLEIKDLSKRYKEVQALEGLNLTIEKGMVFGILGPNGSGKTTTLGILLGILRPGSGTYSWFGNGTRDTNRKRIGALLETPNFYPYLSAVRNLKITGRIKEVEQLDARIESVLKTVDLWERRNSKFRTFSLGMKQRLAIAAALLNNPEVLVLDEPTNGLDPQGIKEIRDLIRKIAAQGTTILLASHQLDEVEKVCSHVAILKKGRLISISAIGALLDHKKQIIVRSESPQFFEANFASLHDTQFQIQEDQSILLSVPDDISTTQINRFFFDQGIVLSELKEVRKSLEEQFLEIIQK
jgi:ABC-2 type transport system ATP-binding protein